MHEHHKIKQADGGKDTRENIAVLDAHCHHALHQIESALKNEKKRLHVPDMLRLLYPEDAKAREFCLYLAMTAALSKDTRSETNKKKEATDYSAFDTEDLVHLTPPKVTVKMRDLVNRVCSETKNPRTGKKLGVGTYIKLLVEQDLRKRGYQP